MSLLNDLARRLGLKSGSELRQEASGHRPSAQPVAAPAELDFVVIDVETSCQRSSSICQIGIVGFAGGREVFTYETLVDPRDEFSPFNTKLHGVAARHVRGKPSFANLHDTLHGHLGGRVTVAHSMFDHGALRAACDVAGRPMIQGRWLDSVKVARHAWPDLSSHRLNVLASHLGLEHRHHDALSDARVAGWVVVKAMDHTGIDLDGWMKGPWRKQPSQQAKRPQAADTGPLVGERVAIMGWVSEPDLPGEIAAAGGKVMAAVGPTTTLLVVVGTRPFDFGIRRSANFVRAEQLIAEGRRLRIVSSAEIRAELAAAS